MTFRESEHKVSTRSLIDAPTTCRQLRKSISFRNDMHGKRFLKWALGSHGPIVITRGPPMARLALTLQSIRGKSKHCFVKLNKRFRKLRSSHDSQGYRLYLDEDAVTRLHLVRKVVFRKRVVCERVRNLNRVKRVYTHQREYIYIRVYVFRSNTRFVTPCS